METHLVTSREKCQLTSNKSSCVINAIHKGTEAPKISKIKIDQGGSKDYFDDSVSVDENGVAYNSEKNAIRLLELIKDQPCLWNFKIPVAERSAYLVAAAWNKVASHFPGSVFIFEEIHLTVLYFTYQ